MLIAQFASGRQQLPFSASHLIVEAGGKTTVSHTLWFSLQGENQAGLNLLAPAIGPIVIPAGSRLRVQLPQGFAKSAEKFYRYILSACETPTPLEFAQLAAIDLYAYSGGTLSAKQFPISIVLDCDEHFALKASCNNIGQLPINPVNGMCRRLVDLSTIYEFNEQLIWRNNTDFIIANPGGTWVRTGLVSTFVDDTTQSDGCDRSLENLGQNVKRPIYRGNNTDSIPTTFWMMNRGSDIIPQGERLGFTIEAGGEDITEIASAVGMLRFQLDGYVTNVGELDTTGANNIGSLPGAGFARGFQSKKTNFRLPKPLPVGQAVAITVWINTSTARAGGILSQGAKIKVSPKVYAQSGSYEGSGLFFGDLIAPSESLADGMGRVYPDLGLSVRVMQRSGCVDSYFFLDIPETSVYGLALNTANQHIGINGNGDVYLIPVGNSASASEAIRAIVGTVDGIASAGSFTNYLALTANSALNFTLAYPYNTNIDLGQIRSDYPDIIAGEYASFNPAYAAIYVQRQSTGEIRKFVELVIPGISQSFKIDNWDGGIVVSSLPVADSNFGFFAPSTPSNFINSTDGISFPADSYRVCFAFKYEASISSISHSSSLGCIEEAPIKIAELYTLHKSWGDSVAFNEIRLIPKSRTFRGQTRRLWDTGDEIYFDSACFDPDNGISIFRPNWVDVSQSGRWILNLKPTAEQILDRLKEVDGANSGLDADLLDGKDAEAFALKNHAHADATTTASGFLNPTDKTTINNLGTTYAPISHAHADATTTASGFLNPTDKTTINNLGTTYAPISHAHADATTTASGFLNPTDKTTINNLGTTYAPISHTHTGITGTTADQFIINSDAANSASDYSLTLSRNSNQSSSYSLVFPNTIGGATQALIISSIASGNKVNLDWGNISSGGSGVLTTTLSGLTSTTGAISSSDNVLAAFGKTLGGLTAVNTRIDNLVVPTAGFFNGGEARTQAALLGNTTNQPLNFLTNNSSRIKITGSGQVNVTNGSEYAIPNNFMRSGSLTLSGLDTQYGGGSNWNTSTAQLLLEFNTSTEIAGHSAGVGLVSFLHYQSTGSIPYKRLTIGRDMLSGTGRIDLLRSSTCSFLQASTDFNFGNYGNFNSYLSAGDRPNISIAGTYPHLFLVSQGAPSGNPGGAIKSLYIGADGVYRHFNRGQGVDGKSYYQAYYEGTDFNPHNGHTSNAGAIHYIMPTYSNSNYLGNGLGVGINNYASNILYNLHIYGTDSNNGTIAWGYNNTRTELKQDANSSDRLGKQSGFFQVGNNPSNYFPGADGNSLLIDCRHTNTVNGFQISGNYGDNILWARKLGFPWYQLLNSFNGWSRQGNDLSTNGWGTMGSTSPHDVIYICNNVEVFRMQPSRPGQILLNTNIGYGSAAAPNYAFLANYGEQCGMFYKSAGVLGFSTNGTERLQVDNGNAINSYLPINITGPTPELRINGQRILTSRQSAIAQVSASSTNAQFATAINAIITTLQTMGINY